MMRAIISVQSLCFLFFGLVSGAAISQVIDHKVAEAKTRTIAALIVDIPLERLGNIKVGADYE